MRILIFIMILLKLNLAQAEEDYRFRPDYWSKGFHLNVGGGFNATYFNSDDLFHDIGYGLNFKTDLGYFLTNRFAVEWSSNVNFNRIEDYLFWDTLFTLGARYRIQEFYLRAFYGKAPTVVYFRDNPPDGYKNSKASRLQFDGPVYGLAFGKTYQHEKGLIWFLETSGTFQSLKEREAIRMDGQVPEVVERRKDSGTVLSIFVMIGVMVF